MSEYRTFEDPSAVPWLDGGVTFFTHEPPQFDHTRAGKRALLRQEVPLFVAWSGRYRTDIFFLDDAARADACERLGVE